MLDNVRTVSVAKTKKPLFIEIKAFYILYFTKDLADFDEEFYAGFVDCFLDVVDDNKMPRCRNPICWGISTG